MLLKDIAFGLLTTGTIGVVLGGGGIVFNELPKLVSIIRSAAGAAAGADAAAEAAIGLAIIVVYYRNRGSIRVEDIHGMKG